MGARFHPAGQASASCNHCPYSGGTQLSPSRADGFSRVCMVAFKSLLITATFSSWSVTVVKSLFSSGWAFPADRLLPSPLDQDLVLSLTPGLNA
jgi:hypothetical protein